MFAVHCDILASGSDSCSNIGRTAHLRYIVCLSFGAESAWTDVTQNSACARLCTRQYIEEQTVMAQLWLQARGNEYMAGILARLQATEPVATDDTFTYCAPEPSAFQNFNGEDLTDAQLDRVLRTHFGLGELYSDGVYTGLTVPTDENGQNLTFKIADGSPGVKAKGSDVPYSNVVGVDIRTCAGPVHVVDRFLTPQGLEGVVVTNGTNGTCTPAIPAIRRAGGDGLLTAVEIAVVRTFSHRRSAALPDAGALPILQLDLLCCAVCGAAGDDRSCSNTPLHIRTCWCRHVAIRK